MNPTWYIQPLSVDKDTMQRMLYAIQELGHEVVAESFTGFDQDWWAEHVKLGQRILPLCSINALKGLQDFAKKFGTVGTCVWADWDNLKCSTYYAHWGEFLLAKRYGFYPLGEVRRLREELWYIYGNDKGRAFIRPDTNDKVFCGGVVHLHNLGGWLAMANGQCDDELLCLVARPEPIAAEYRLVVANGKVIAGSQYRLDDYIEYVEGIPDPARALAEAAAKKWSPHPIFVMDIAADYNRNFSIIECGSIHCAGLYSCDLRAVAKAMAAIAAEEKR